MIKQLLVYNIITGKCLLIPLKAANDNKNQRRAFHASEISDEDLEAIRNAKVPPGHEYLDELLE